MTVPFLIRRIPLRFNIHIPKSCTLQDYRLLLFLPLPLEVVFKAFILYLRFVLPQLYWLLRHFLILPGYHGYFIITHYSYFSQVYFNSTHFYYMEDFCPLKIIILVLIVLSITSICLLSSTTYSSSPSNHF